MILTFVLVFTVIAAILLMLYSGVALVQEKWLFSSAPKDIQEKIQPKPERFKGAKVLGWILMIISFIMIGASAVTAIWDGKRNKYTFRQYFKRFITIFYAYKAFDIIFLDWFMLHKTHFYQHYYPETEGCKGYHNFGFNKKSQIARILIYPLISAAAAKLCTLSDKK